MATLSRHRNGSQLALPADALVGRGNDNDVPLWSGGASRPHALIRWAQRAWYLLDLDSKNGTYINSRRLQAGKTERLSRGDQLQFGPETERFTMLEGGPPETLARHLTTSRTVTMQGGLLSLPDADDPIASISEGHSLTHLEIDMGSRLGPIFDREVIAIHGEPWQLRICALQPASTVHASHPLALTSLALEFRADPAWLSIEIAINHESSHVLHIKHYAHNELLLVLANERLREQELNIAARQCGWLDTAVLAGRLNCSEQAVNTLVHRARRQFECLGIAPAVDLIERRPNQLRIGIASLTLHDDARRCAAAGGPPKAPHGSR